MSSRLFVATEVGFWHDPTIVAFATAVREPLAGAYVLRLREAVLAYGDPERPGTLPARWGATEIAGAVGWPRKPAVLVRALQKAGHLRRGRGGRWIYPEWSATVTGEYQGRKLRERERWHERNEEARREAARAKLTVLAGGRGAETPIPLHGASVEAPRSIRDQASNQGDPPPQAPPPGGDPAASRLGWLREHYPLGIVEETKVAAALEALTPDEWDHLQWVVTSVYKGKNPRFLPTAERLTIKSAFKRVKRPKGQKAKAKPEATAAPAAPPPDPERTRARFERLSEIRKELAAAGVHRRELEVRAFEQLERELGPEGAA